MPKPPIKRTAKNAKLYDFLERMGWENSELIAALIHMNYIAKMKEQGK